MYASDDLQRLLLGYDELVLMSKKIIKRYSNITDMPILNNIPPQELVNDLFLHRLPRILKFFENNTHFDDKVARAKYMSVCLYSHLKVMIYERRFPLPETGSNTNNLLGISEERVESNYYIAYMSEQFNKCSLKVKRWLLYNTNKELKPQLYDGKKDEAIRKEWQRARDEFNDLLERNDIREDLIAVFVNSTQWKTLRKVWLQDTGIKENEEMDMISKG